MTTQPATGGTSSASVTPARAVTIPQEGGSALLLELLGGILLAATVGCAGSFVEALLQPFYRNSAASPAAHVLALITYLGLLLHLFRQIHGLAIVADDPSYVSEVAAHLTQAGRVISMLGLVFVLFFPAGLIAILCSTTIEPLHYLLDYMHISPLSHGPAAILAFLVLNAMAYVLWDTICARQASANSIDTRTRRWRLTTHAVGYREFLHNWIWLSAYAAIIGLLAGVLLFGISTGSGMAVVPQILGQRSLIPVLLILTYGYSVADYVLNRNFYFRARTLEELRQRRVAGGTAMNANSLKGLVILGLGIIVGSFVLYFRASTPPPDLNLQLKWLFNAGFAGDFVAKERYWKTLNVSVKPGGPGADPIKLVTSGKAQIGVATGDQLIMAVVNEGAPVVAIGLVYQTNPLAWITRKDSGIVKPADLRGKTIGLTFTDDEALFRTMLATLGMTEDDLTIQRVAFDPMPFLKNEVHAYPVFRNTQGTELALRLAKDRIDTRFVAPSDIGIVSYSNLYFTTRKYADEHPERLRTFMHDVIAAWEFCQTNPRDAAIAVAKYDRETALDVIKACISATNKLVRPVDTAQIGQMSKEGWQKTQDVLFTSGQIRSRVDVSTLYTNGFLPDAP